MTRTYVANFFLFREDCKRFFRRECPRKLLNAKKKKRTSSEVLFRLEKRIFGFMGLMKNV